MSPTVPERQVREPAPLRRTPPVDIPALQAEVERASPALRPLLARLRDTFWAGCIERDVGWYMMSGAVETPKAKAIRYLVNKCVPELRPVAEEITHAVAIPDAALAAPIALDPLPTEHE